MSMLRRTWSLIDWPLTAVVLTLIGLGLLNLYSATRVAPKGMFSSQLLWIAVGTLILIAVAAFDPKWLRRLAWPAYLGVTGLLVAVLLVGKVVNGSRRWFGWRALGCGRLSSHRFIGALGWMGRRGSSVEMLF